ncbi:hypothetical protein PoB_005134900 [Plakobranchus ocellatus]|uniref:G-protein coupled receptors family 1 profile domain-containing protein n=1 Tax=Plakobranchus ocellatus TaxID=259542 RepID=A0AAV4BXA6_9GAST|nr:hypothetical protein PoB_005134900 [Plakobranchus ocellatus]
MNQAQQKKPPISQQENITRTAATDKCKSENFTSETADTVIQTNPIITAEGKCESLSQFSQESLPHNEQANLGVASTAKHTDSNSSSRTGTAAQETSSKEHRLIKTVLILAIMHVLLSFPHLIYFVVYSLLPQAQQLKSYKNLFLTAGKFTNVANSLNGMLNTFVYLTVNQKYKTHFKNMYCKR